MGEKGAYVVQAGRLIKQALSYERNAEYQEAFDLFKAGVDVLLNGVQSEWVIPRTLLPLVCILNPAPTVYMYMQVTPPPFAYIYFIYLPCLF